MKKEKSQKQKFIEAAKEHGCDESEIAFEKKLTKITKTTVSKKPANKKKK